MPDLDDLARRTVAAVTGLARVGIALATRVALVTALIAVIAYLLGLAAFSGNARSAWVVVGGALVIVAVGAPLLARWRLSSVVNDAGELVTEVRRLLVDNAEAERVVIETVEVPGSTGGAMPVVVGQSAQFTRLRNVALRANDLRSLPGTLAAVTTFPFLLLVALVLSLMFIVLGFVFLIAVII